MNYEVCGTLVIVVLIVALILYQYYKDKKYTKYLVPLGAALAIAAGCYLTKDSQFSYKSLMGGGRSTSMWGGSCGCEGGGEHLDDMLDA